MDKIIYKQNKLSFELDTVHLTATIVNSNEASGDILIPRSVSYQSQDYIITKIGEKAFNESAHLESINFAKDSELRSIGKKAFSSSNISTLYIPSTFELFEEDWCYDAYKLDTIYISSDNPNIKYSDESKKIIIGKSNPNNDNFDLLVFVSINIKELIIPSTIKRFGCCTFHSYLRGVKFEGNSSLEIIDKNAFSSYKDFITIPNNFTIPSSVKYIGCICSLPTKRFNNIISSENPNFKYIDDSMIIGKSDPNIEEFDTIISARLDIQKAIIPSYIKHINSFAFYKCSDLTTVEFQSNSQLISIGKYAFYGCSIKEIKIPSSCQKIKKQAFYNCHKLHTFELPDDSQLKKIPQLLFGRSVTSFKIPKNVEKISPNWSRLDDYSKVYISPENHNYSFLNEDHNIIVGKSNPKSDIFDVIVSASCDITNVFIPSNITRIESYAFHQCRKILTLEFDKDIQLKSIGEGAFSSTSIRQIDIPSSVIEISSKCFLFSSNLNSINIKEDSKLEFFGKKAFFITSISKIFIPAHVIQFPFDSNLRSLYQIDLSPENPNYKYLNEDKLIIIGKSESNSNFDSIVFASKGITEISIPSTILYIKSYAFSGCKLLNEIKFEKNSQLIEIGDHAFDGCNIVEITIPSHVKRINDFCFENCDNLRKLEFEPNSELNCFSKFSFINSGIENISIPSSVSELKSRWLMDARKLKNIYLDADNKFFRYSDESNKMILGKSDKNSDVFDVINFVNKNCTELEIPSNIKIIDANSFAYCHINHIFIPKSVVHICAQAFLHCRASSLVFEEDSNLSLIEYEAFNFDFIKYFKLPSKIKYLDLNCFSNSDEWKFIEIFGDEIYVSTDEQMLSSFVISFPNARKVQFDGVISNAVFFTLPNIEFV